MLRKIYAIRDAKAEVYNEHLMVLKTHGEAERYFAGLVNDARTQLSMTPEDFDLFYLGEFDDNLGTITALKTPQHIQKALHVKKAYSVKEGDFSETSVKREIKEQNKVLDEILTKSESVHGH